MKVLLGFNSLCEKSPKTGVINHEKGICASAVNPAYEKLPKETQWDSRDDGTTLRIKDFINTEILWDEFLKDLRNAENRVSQTGHCLKASSAFRNTQRNLTAWAKFPCSYFLHLQLAEHAVLEMGAPQRGGGNLSFWWEIALNKLLAWGVIFSQECVLLKWLYDSATVES